MKSSVGDLVFKHYFENVSTCTYTLDIVRKSSNLLHRVKIPKLLNWAEIENSIYNSTLLIPEIPSLSILDKNCGSLFSNLTVSWVGPFQQGKLFLINFYICGPKLTHLVFLESGGLKCILNFQYQLNLTILFWPYVANYYIFLQCLMFKYKLTHFQNNAWIPIRQHYSS